MSWKHARDGFGGADISGSYRYYLERRVIERRYARGCIPFRTALFVMLSERPT